VRDGVNKKSETQGPSPSPSFPHRNNTIKYKYFIVVLCGGPDREEKGKEEMKGCTLVLPLPELSARIGRRREVEGGGGGRR